MMEKELGFTLFERKNNGIKLTAEGTIFYQETRKTLQSYQNAIKQVQQYMSQSKMNIRVFIAKYLNDTILYACKNVSHKINNYSFSFCFEPLLSCYNALKVPMNHPLASLKNVTLEQLKNQTILVSSDIHKQENIKYINHLLKKPEYKINVIEFKSLEEANAKNVINSYPLATLSCFDSSINYKLIPILDVKTVDMGMIYRKEDLLMLQPVLDAFKEYFKNYVQENELIFPYKHDKNK